MQSDHKIIGIGNIETNAKWKNVTIHLWDREITKTKILLAETPFKVLEMELIPEIFHHR